MNATQANEKARLESKALECNRWVYRNENNEQNDYTVLDREIREPGFRLVSVFVNGEQLVNREKTNPALTEGCKFAMGAIQCTITRISAFGSTQHYGFLWYSDDHSKIEQGWMPCEFVDNFTGHFRTAQQQKS